MWAVEVFFYVETNLTTFYICNVARFITEVFVYILQLCDRYHRWSFKFLSNANGSILNLLCTNVKSLKYKKKNKNEPFVDFRHLKWVWPDS